MTAKSDDREVTSAAGVTVLVEFRLAGPPGGAQDLAVRVAAAISETFGERTGFEAATLLVSTDGRRMVNIASWASEDDWHAATDDSDGGQPPGDGTDHGDWLARRSKDEPVAKILRDGGATLDQVAAFRQVATVGKSFFYAATPAVAKNADRPALHGDDAEAYEAVQDLVKRLQNGLDAADADVYDATFAADILWGTPKGKVVDGVGELLPIHRRLMAENAAPASTFELASWRCPAPGVAVAQIRRRAHQATEFAEVAVYTLIQRDQRWWVAAAQNTPILEDVARP